MKIIKTIFALWSGAKGPTKPPLTYLEPSDSWLLNGVLFISIRQIFAHIFASKNKVSETTFSKFRKFLKLQETPQNLKMRWKR